MIVADTGAVVALIDVDDRHHRVLREVFVREPERWILPSMILPEVDYLLLEHVGRQAEAIFVEDLAVGNWRVEWGDRAYLTRAHEILQQYPALDLGLVDAVVMATAERLRADAIATLDLRDFSAVKIDGSPRLIPRDL